MPKCKICDDTGVVVFKVRADTILNKNGLPMYPREKYHEMSAGCTCIGGPGVPKEEWVQQELKWEDIK